MKNIFSCVRWTLAAGGIMLGLTWNAHAQKTFPTAEQATDAFIKAVSAHDQSGLRTILGSDWKTFIPTENIDKEDVDAFLAAAAKSHHVVSTDTGFKELAVGDQNWTLPIPLKQVKSGWQFDPKEGGEEMRTRRVGRNELDVMKAALAFYDAQREYAQKDHNGDGIPEYAQKFISTPGKQDGLYWETDGGKESPLGPLFGGDKPGKEYHGYLFHILTSQGPHAPGGAYDYMIGGKLKGGFALVAWPVDYDDTGVKTFIINHDGQIYEKDLGEKTDSLARAIKQFDPDPSWKKVTVPD